MRKYEPNAELTKHAHISSIEDYRRMYDDSIKNPESFWEGQADRIHGPRNGIKYGTGISTMRI